MTGMTEEELVDCVKKAIGIYESAPTCTGYLFGFDEDLRAAIGAFAVAGNHPHYYPSALEAAVADSMGDVPMCAEGAIYLAAWRTTGDIHQTERLGELSIFSVNRQSARALYRDHDDGKNDLVRKALYGFVGW